MPHPNTLVVLLCNSELHKNYHYILVITEYKQLSISKTHNFLALCHNKYLLFEIVTIQTAHHIQSTV